MINQLIRYSEKIGCIIAAIIFSSNSFAAPLNTSTVIKASVEAAPHCLHYKVTGLCFWMHCHGIFCKFATTLKVDHYLPDAVVSVYRQKGDNPWDYGKAALDPLAYKAGNAQTESAYGIPLGGGNTPVNTVHDSNNHFKEVDIVGNPALLAYRSLGLLLLPSAAAPFHPYYLSMSDSLAWRSALLEMFYPASVVPGLHEVGSFPFNDWGPIYPRTGFVNQPNDAKAAAVAAQRAADLATKTAQPHLYWPLPSGGNGDHRSIKAVTENSDDTAKWQMVYPIESHQCEIFGVNDVTNPKPWGSVAMQKTKGNYSWILWRHYQGCIPSKGHVISVINWS